MPITSLLRTSVPGLVTVLLCGLAFTMYFRAESQRATQHAIDTYLKSEIRPRLQEKSHAIDIYFRSIFDSTRVISLLPGVRGLTGHNRSDPTLDAREASGLDLHDYRTLEAIYENLAGNTRLSELYVTLEGFDDQAGDVPLFMFDSVITGEKRERMPQSEESLDTPQQDESAEYAYLADLLRSVGSSHPVWRFQSPRQVPFFISAPMRTCDNSQYTSLKQGNVRDTIGLMLSTPFYNESDGRLRGVISAVIRLNALEALLTGAPMVLVTEEDHAVARTRGWVAPPVSPLVLRDSSGRISVHDRRNPTIIADVKHGEPDVNVFSVPLNMPDGSTWQLSYFLSATEKARFVDEVRRVYRLPFFATALLTLLAMTAVLLFHYLRLSNQRLNDMLSNVQDAKVQAQERSRELVDTQQKLVASEKRAALGVFTAGIAHEINNPANFAAVGTQNAEVQINELRHFINELIHHDSDAELREAFGSRFRKIEMSLNAIRSGITRIERVVKSLRASHPENEDLMEECPVVDLLESAWQVVAPSIKAPITLRKQLYARPVIFCRVGDLHQTFIGLLTNAGHAIEDSVQQRNNDLNGEITLESWEEGNDLCIAITDNGTGVAPAIRERIFDPFFTTKVAGRGSGLGLSTARAVIHAHGGTLQLDHARVPGARFVIRLPLQEPGIGQ